MGSRADRRVFWSRSCCTPESAWTGTTALSPVLPTDRTRTDFFASLVQRKFATAYTCAHKRARIFHLHHRALYDAVGEPHSRFRKPTPIGVAIERMMVLDAVLSSSGVSWLASERDKLAHFCRLLRARLDQEEFPHITFGNGVRRCVRYFPDKLPIGVVDEGREHIFVLSRHACRARGLQSVPLAPCRTAPSARSLDAAPVDPWPLSRSQGRVRVGMEAGVCESSSPIYRRRAEVVLRTASRASHRRARTITNVISSGTRRPDMPSAHLDIESSIALGCAKEAGSSTRRVRPRSPMPSRAERDALRHTYSPVHISTSLPWLARHEPSSWGDTSGDKRLGGCCLPPW